MAVAVRMRYPGMKPADYDRLMLSFGLDESPPIGEILHLAVERGERIEAWDVWQTAQAAEAFVENRLRPALRQLRLNVEPEFELMPLHNLYAADLDMVERIGALSLPSVDAGAVL